MISDSELNFLSRYNLIDRMSPVYAVFDEDDKETNLIVVRTLKSTTIRFQKDDKLFTVLNLLIKHQADMAEELLRRRKWWKIW